MPRHPLPIQAPCHKVLFHSIPKRNNNNANVTSTHMACAATAKPTNHPFPTTVASAIDAYPTWTTTAPG
eukprot:scaffold105105_cov62-Attheya_sp.AAC.6